MTEDELSKELVEKIREEKSLEDSLRELNRKRHHFKTSLESLYELLDRDYSDAASNWGIVRTPDLDDWPDKDQLRDLLKTLRETNKKLGSTKSRIDQIKNLLASQLPE